MARAADLQETVTVRLKRTAQSLALRAVVARSWRARMVGLLGHAKLEDGEAMVFPGCGAIHTVGMRFAIDVIFTDRAWRIVSLRARVTPGRLAVLGRRAWAVIEAAEGTIERFALQVGDELDLD